MPTPTIDEFWELAVRCRLIEPEAAEVLRREHAAQPEAGGPLDAAKTVKGTASWLVSRGVLTRWQAKRLSAGDTGPFFLGDYRLLERHDRDGDGLQFTSRHEPSGRLVDLMLLNAKLCKQLDVWTEIVRRTTAAHRAADPMLSRTWTLEQYEGSRFIVCENVPGTNLADEIERLGPLPPNQAGILTWQIARAVAEIHGLGSVHGGLSLDALRREPPPQGGGERTGRVRLLQFPLCGDPHRVPLRPLVANEAEVARLARRAAYVAPELLVPGAACDERSDVYAIGGILYALLAGTPPCWEGDPRATLKRASFSGPAPLPATVPPEIATLVGYLMARAADARYATGAEAADAIAACLGIAAPAVSPRPAAAPGQQQAALPSLQGEAAPSIAAGMAERKPKAASRLSDQQALLAARARRLRLIGGAVAATIVLVAAGLVVSRMDFSVNVPGGGGAGGRPRKPSAVDDTDLAGESQDTIDRRKEPVRAGPPPDDGKPPVAAVTKPPAVKPAAGATQVIVDSDVLPWASPTTGPPPTLAYLPPGSQLILLARLGAIAADGEGSLFLKALGPVAESAVETLVKLSGGDVAAIELVQAGWQAGGVDEVVGGYAVRFAEGSAAPADDAARAAAWGQTSEVEIEGETVHETATLALWVPKAQRGRVLVILPKRMVARDDALTPGKPAPQEPMIAQLIRAAAEADADRSKLQAALPRDLEMLVGMLDADRHVTLFGSPHYLLNKGRPVLAGPLAKLAEPIDHLFGESLQAAGLSLHFGDSFYAELDAVATLDVPAATLAPALAERVDQIPTHVEEYCAALNADPYGRALVMRLPGMIRELSAELRTAPEGPGAVLNAYLPQHAAHNLALAAELALAQTPGAAVAAVAAGPGAGAATPQDALGKLQKKMTLTFVKDNLERSIQMVSEEIGVPMEILGNDLQLEGITKNQSFGLEERDKTADAILQTILAKSNPDGKLVYIVVKENGEEVIKITTRAAVEKRGDKLPPVYAGDEKPKKKP